MMVQKKYKICKRLGANIFEKCDTQKFAIAKTRNTSRKQGGRKPRRNASDFAGQLNEKQKARLMYGLRERQFARYVAQAVSKKHVDSADGLFQNMERRLDNVCFRLGLAKTRAAARQLASHGHLCVNGKRVTIPSHTLGVGDTVSIRAGSRNKTVFSDLNERLKEATIPSWLSLDYEKKEGKIVGMPHYVPSESLFDLNAVIEFYSR